MILIRMIEMILKALDAANEVRATRVAAWTMYTEISRHYLALIFV